MRYCNNACLNKDSYSDFHRSRDIRFGIILLQLRLRQYGNMLLLKGLDGCCLKFSCLLKTVNNAVKRWKGYLDSTTSNSNPQLSPQVNCLGSERLNHEKQLFTSTWSSAEWSDLLASTMLSWEAIVDLNYYITYNNTHFSLLIWLSNSLLFSFWLESCDITVDFWKLHNRRILTSANIVLSRFWYAVISLKALSSSEWRDWLVRRALVESTYLIVGGRVTICHSSHLSL